MHHALEKRTRQITEGPIVRSLLVIAGPIVFTNILHSAYQLVDMFWVGRLGADGLAAVSVCYPIIFFLMSAGLGLSIAGSVFVAQYAGARRHDMLNHVSGQTLLMIAMVSVVVSVIGYFGSPFILRLIGVHEQIFENANRFLQISFLGLIFSFGFMVSQSLLRGIGEVRFPLYVISSTVILNAVVVPVFIFGWGPVPALGVPGAAAATVLTQAIAAVVGMGVLFSGRYGIHLRARDFVPDLEFIRRAILVALPASVEQSTRTFGSILLTFLATGFGTLALATYGVGTRILSFVFIPAFGLAMATSTLVAQNIGAGNVRRAEDVARLSGWVAFWSLNGVAILFAIFAVPMVRVFVPGDEALVAAGAEFVYIVSLSFGIIGAQQALLGAFRGAGSTTSAMVISLVTQFVLQFPMSYIMCYHTSLGVTGVWWGFPVANFVATIMTIVWFRRGTWKDVELIGWKRAHRRPGDRVLAEEVAGEQEYIS
ncbi:MAG: MATE family efflux transporter [Gammaproteobacteria bacterium]|nr:MATE family efflux transporter [Gammaproteobacteria bacterium]